MKRDMQLIRKILLKADDMPLEQRGSIIEIEGHDQQTISYHVMLLHEAGLLKGIDMSSMSDIEWFVDRLTWDGYEFLEASKNESLWNKAVQLVGNKGGGLAFEVLKQVLISLVKDAALGSTP